jgi:AcrR family transcriptional regulator
LLPDRRWSQLVDTAVAVLDTVPLHDVVIDDIATKAGVSRSLVYRYFSGLDDLLRHARQRFLTTLETNYEPILSSGADALDKLRAVIAATVHFAAAHPGVYGNFATGRRVDSTAGDPLTTAMLHLISVLRPGRDAVLVATGTAALIDAAIGSWLRDDPTESETVIDLVFGLAAFGLQGDRAPSGQHGADRPSRRGCGEAFALSTDAVARGFPGEPSGSGKKGPLMTMEKDQ